MEEILSQVMMLIGAIFILIASIGVVRLPDLFMRMHSNSKSATLGVLFIMLGLALHFDTLAIYIRALAVVLFFMITAPVAAQIIGRAAYFSGVPLWEETLSDVLKDQYDHTTHRIYPIPPKDHKPPHQSS